MNDRRVDVYTGIGTVLRWLSEFAGGLKSQVRVVIEMPHKPVVATALLDRLPHHAIVIQTDGTRYRLKALSDLIQSGAETSETKPLRPKKGELIYNNGFSPITSMWDICSALLGI